MSFYTLDRFCSYLASANDADRRTFASMYQAKLVAIGREGKMRAARFRSIKQQLDALARENSRT